MAREWIARLRLQTEDAKSEAAELQDRIDDLRGEVEKPATIEVDGSDASRVTENLADDVQDLRGDVEQPTELDVDGAKARKELQETSAKATEELDKIEGKSRKTKDFLGKIVSEFERMTGIDLGPLSAVIEKIPLKLAGVGLAIGAVVAGIQYWKREEEKLNEVIEETTERWARVLEEEDVFKRASAFVEEFRDDLLALEDAGVGLEEGFRLITGEVDDLGRALNFDAAALLSKLKIGYENASREAIILKFVQEEIAIEMRDAAIASGEMSEGFTTAQEIIAFEIEKAKRGIGDYAETFEQATEDVGSAFDELRGRLNIETETEKMKLDIAAAYVKMTTGADLTGVEINRLALDFLNLAEDIDTLPDEQVIEIVDNFLESNSDLGILLDGLNALDGKAVYSKAYIDYIVGDLPAGTFLPRDQGGSGGGGTGDVINNFTIQTPQSAREVQRVLGKSNARNGVV